MEGKLTEQLEKILPLDEGILAELVDDEKSTEEDVTAEIGESARLKAEVTQRLVASHAVVFRGLVLLPPCWEEVIRVP